MPGLSGTLAYDPSQLAGLSPGANLGGSPGSPLAPTSAGPAIGTSGGNPMIAPMPTGQGVNTNLPSLSSPYDPSGATTALTGLKPGTPETSGNLGDIAKSLQHTYYGGAGTALAQFLQQGAGFSPEVAKALIASMQPQIEKGRANLMEQFGSMGLGMGSPAALGMGDYLAQTNLDVGQLLSGLYEQSVQNYMEVLMGTKGQGVNTGQQLAQTAVGALLGNVSGTMSTGGGGSVTI